MKSLPLIEFRIRKKRHIVLILTSAYRVNFRLEYRFDQQKPKSAHWDIQGSYLLFYREVFAMATDPVLRRD